MFSIETEGCVWPFIFRLSLQGVDGQHQIYVEWTDDCGRDEPHAELITDEPHVWQVMGTRAETATSCDGTYTLLIDGIWVDGRRHVDNFHTWGRATIAKFGGACQYDVSKAARTARMKATAKVKARAEGGSDSPCKQFSPRAGSRIFCTCGYWKGDHVRRSHEIVSLDCETGNLDDDEATVSDGCNLARRGVLRMKFTVDITADGSRSGIPILDVIRAIEEQLLDAKLTVRNMVNVEEGTVKIRSVTVSSTTHLVG